MSVLKALEAQGILIAGGAGGPSEAPGRLSQRDLCAAAAHSWGIIVAILSVSSQNSKRMRCWLFGTFTAKLLRARCDLLRVLGAGQHSAPGGTEVSAVTGETLIYRMPHFANSSYA